MKLKGVAVFAQVLSFQLKEGFEEEFQTALDAWKKNAGLKISGCTQIITCFETGGLDRCTVVILFSTKEALAEFDRNSDTLDAFDDAKRMMDGSIQFYEARVDSTPLE